MPSEDTCCNTCGPDVGTGVPTPDPARLRPAPRSGWPAFDDLGLVRPGRLLLVDVGAREGDDLLLGLLADAAAAPGGALVVDGGNWLDVYRLGDAAVARGGERDEALESVRVARGFTAHQLQSLVEDALPDLAAREPPALVLAPGLPDMYLDPDLKAPEARELLRRALASLRALAARAGVPVVASNASLHPRARHALRVVLEAGVDDVAHFAPAPHGALRVVVPRRGVAVLARGPGARQRSLADYAVDAVRAERAVDAEGAEDAALRDVGVFFRPVDHYRYLPKRAGELRFRQRAALVGGA